MRVTKGTKLNRPGNRYFTDVLLNSREGEVYDFIFKLHSTEPSITAVMLREMVMAKFGNDYPVKYNRREVTRPLPSIRSFERALAFFRKGRKLKSMSKPEPEYYI